MKRWLPAPLLSAALLAMWLMLHPSLDAVDWLLGVALAVLLPRLLAALRPAAGPVRQPLVAARLALRVAVEVVHSALDVAAGILRAGRRPPRGAFVTVPLELRDTHGLAVLAVITAVIPGTVWSELAPDRSALLLHVFDLDDEAAFVHRFKARYERPLMEIFQ
jgi:multicomponent K+:H+ antiporter subunit E